MRAPGCRERRAEPPPKPGLRLLSPGAAPRVALRYRFVRGRVVHYRLRAEQQLVGARQPPARQEQHLTYAVDRVRGPRAQVRWRVEAGARPAGRPGQALWLQLTERGAVEAVAAGKGRKVADPVLRQTLTSFQPRFPEAALGVGARWLETRALTWRPAPGLPPFEALLRASYTLERLAPCGQARCAELSVSVAVELTHQVGDRRLRGQGTGSGQVKLDLARGVIVHATSRSELEVKAQAGGGRIAEIFRLRQELEEVRAPVTGPRAATPRPQPGGAPSGATPARDAPRSASGSAPPAAPRAR